MYQAYLSGRAEKGKNFDCESRWCMHDMIRIHINSFPSLFERKYFTDPSESWYQGELGFYDFYIIPLAKKLDQCGAFGVSSDEFLNYAKENRQEWEKKGKDIVATYLEKYKTQEIPEDEEKAPDVEQENEQQPVNIEHGSQFSGAAHDNREYGSYGGDQFNYPVHKQQYGENYDYSAYQGQNEMEQRKYSEYQDGYNRGYQGQYNSEPYNYGEPGRQ